MRKIFNINCTLSISIKSLFILSFTAFILSDAVAVSGVIQQKQATTNKAKYVEGEVLVKYKSNVTAQAQQSISMNLGGLSSLSVGKNKKILLCMEERMSTFLALLWWSAFHMSPELNITNYFKNL